MSRRVFFISAVLTLAAGMVVLVLPTNTSLLGSMSLLEAYWLVVSGGYGLVTLANWRVAHNQVQRAKEPPTDEIEVEQALLYRFIQSFFLACHITQLLVGVVSAFVPPPAIVPVRAIASTLLLAGILVLPVGLGLASVEIHIRRRRMTQLMIKRVRRQPELDEEDRARNWDEAGHKDKGGK